jgi:hypothetical protein
MNDLENATIHCHKEYPRKRLPGEKYVETPRECFSGEENEKGYCKGVAVGLSCSNNGDADCDVDLFCSSASKTCEKAKVEGDYCNRKTRCASFLICAWEDGVEAKCRPYGYLMTGAQAGAGDDSDLCDEHYLANVNDNFICQKGPLLIGTNIKEAPGEKCGYSHGEDDHSKCYYHAEGKAMCRRGAGDLMYEWKIVNSAKITE